MWPLKSEGGFNRQNMGKGTALAKASWQVRAILVWGGQLSSLGGVQGLCRPIMGPGSVKMAGVRMQDGLEQESLEAGRSVRNAGCGLDTRS